MCLRSPHAGGSVYDLLDAKGRSTAAGVVPPSTAAAHNGAPADADGVHVTQLVTVVFGPGQIDPSQVQVRGRCISPLPQNEKAALLSAPSQPNV